MELSKTKFAGIEVNVMYTGSFYFFYSNFYSLLAVAKRITPAGSERGREVFKLTTGNRHCIGGRLANSVCASCAKRFINKDASRFVETVVTYTEDVKDLADCSLRVEALGI